MKESFKVTVMADSCERCEQIGEILREHYTIVVNTGIAENARPPHMGKWRGYYTIVVDEPDEDGEGD